MNIVENEFANIDLAEQSPETLLLIGISSLQLFVQDNFTGPPLKDNSAYESLRHQINISNEVINQYLISDSVEINCNATNAWLLALAKLIFSHLQMTSDCALNEIIYKSWYLRYCYIHQLVLDEDAGSLYDSLSTISDEIMQRLETAMPDIETRTLLVLEIASIQLHYRRVWLAEKTLQTAAKHLNATVHIEGRLGVRTKFQQKALPQLLLRIETDGTIALDAAAVTHTTSIDNQIPALLQLDDDTRLERVKFVDAADNDVINVCSVLQSLILNKLYVL